MYTRGKPFKEFAIKLQNLRQTAHNNEDIGLSTCCKLLGNMAIGRLNLKAEGAEKVAIVSMADMPKRMRNSRLIASRCGNNILVDQLQNFLTV